MVKPLSRALGVLSTLGVAPPAGAQFKVAPPAGAQFKVAPPTGALLRLATSAGAVLLFATPAMAEDLSVEAEDAALGIADRVLEAFADSMPSTRFALSSDLRVRTAAIWGEEGAIAFPDPAHDHVQLELSKTETDALFLLMQDAGGAWHQTALKQGHLIYCQSARRICLILNRAAFAEALGATSDDLNDALFNPNRAAAGMAPALGLLVLTAGAATLAGAFVFARRARAADSTRVDPDRFTIGDIDIFPAALKATRAGAEVDLTRRDIAILRHMYDRHGAVVSKDELYDAGWGRDYMPNSRALDQHILALRRKLDPDQSRTEVIETVRGAGYRLAP